VSAEIVIATPLLLLLLSAVVQFGLYEHAQHVATTAAQEAVAAARVQGGSARAGQDRAKGVLHVLGSSLLVDPQVNVTRTGTQARADVTGFVEEAVPFLHLPIHAVAEGPVEPGARP
jgi:Flp pilus assembly protein TadG